MSTPTSDEDVERIRAAIFAGRKIEAIKLYRRCSGAGLREAKDFIEALEREMRAAAQENFTAAPAGKGDRWLPAFLAGAFVLIGLGGMGYGTFLVSQARESAGWPQTDGRIVRSKVIPAREGDRLEIEYAYEVAGVPYTARRIYFGDHLTLSSRNDAGTYATRYPVGNPVSLAYDPEDPADAVLEPGARKPG